MIAEFANRGRTERHTVRKWWSSFTAIALNLPWYSVPDPVLPCAACHRRTCVPVSQAMNADRSPDRSGQSTRCQWFGMTAKSRIRIGRWSAASRITRTNAS
jgi:hypothetical protein